METKAQKTRRGVLDAAERLVDRHGAARLTLAGVAWEAGVSKGGLLYHFGTRDELIAAMLAAVANNPKLLCPLQDRYADW